MTWAPQQVLLQRRAWVRRQQVQPLLLRWAWQLPGQRRLLWLRTFYRQARVQLQVLRWLIWNSLWVWSQSKAVQPGFFSAGFAAGGVEDLAAGFLATGGAAGAAGWAAALAPGLVLGWAGFEAVLLVGVLMAVLAAGLAAVWVAGRWGAAGAAAFFAVAAGLGLAVFAGGAFLWAAFGADGLLTERPPPRRGTRVCNGGPGRWRRGLCRFGTVRARPRYGGVQSRLRAASLPGHGLLQTDPTNLPDSKARGL